MNADQRVGCCELEISGGEREKAGGGTNCSGGNASRNESCCNESRLIQREPGSINCSPR
jgi:hypothetical protein